MRDIAIIGAGAAGTLLLSELLRQSRPAQCRLHWWHGTQPPGRGVAYATDDPEHLLNVRSAGIGMHADAPGDFLAALQASDPQARGSLLRGSLWECAGLSEIRQRGARQVAAALPTGISASGHKQIVPGQFAGLSA